MWVARMPLWGLGGFKNRLIKENTVGTTEINACGDSRLRGPRSRKFVE